MSCVKSHKHTPAILSLQGLAWCLERCSSSGLQLLLLQLRRRQWMTRCVQADVGLLLPHMVAHLPHQTLFVLGVSCNPRCTHTTHLSFFSLQVNAFLAELANL